jgi:hypothetical protein
VLHKEKYGPRGNAAEIVRITAPAGVTIAYENSFGEFETRLALAELLGDIGLAAAAARGHDGDRLALLTTRAGEGLAWVSTWDTPLDAEEFAETAAKAFAKRYASTVQVTGGRREVVGQGRRLTIRTDKSGARDIVIVEDLPSASASPVIPASAVSITPR